MSWFWYRISQLPDETIHQILSYTSTVDAVRLSLVSRQWRHVCHSVPSLGFSFFSNPFWKSNTRNDYEQIQLFDVLVEECLKRCLEDMQAGSDSIVMSFKLTLLFTSAVADALTRLLTSPRTINNIKELDLWAFNSSYDIPFEVLSSRSLSVAKFYSLGLGSLDCPVILPSLRWLELHSVSPISDEVLNRLLLGCPSIERLELIGLRLNHSKVSSLSLKSLEFRMFECKTLSVHALNLHSLVIHGEFHEADFSSCVAIRNLELHYFMTDTTFADIEHKFTLLESLHLAECWPKCNTRKELRVVQEFTIRSRSLRRFTMRRGSDCVRLKLNFDTPNLVSFCYVGDLRFRMTMTSPNDQLNGKIISLMGFPCSQLLKFFAGLCWSCNTLAIDLKTDKLQLKAKLFMKNSNSNPTWPDRKHIEVEVFHAEERKSKLKSLLKSSEPMRSSSFGKQMQEAMHWIVEKYATGA